MFRSKPFFALALTSCLLLLGGAARAQEATGPAASGELNDFEDLAGLLTQDSSGEKVLYAMEEHSENVLTALNAQPYEDGRYQALVGEETVTFRLSLVAYPAFYFPQLICANGLVRVYRNASCAQTQPAYSTACISPYPYTYSYRLYQNPVRKCKAGFGYCVEVFQPYRFRNDYQWNDCTIPRYPYTTVIGSDFIC